MTRGKQKFILFGVLCGLSLSALEINVVSTATPRIIKDLGGLNHYSWVFTIYLLASTLAMPFWGHAADHWGRKKLFLTSMSLFLVGSFLCGLSQSMSQLILFRAIKGLGGGGLTPLAFTILADIYDLKNRTKIQGYISSVWGVASLVGPFIGGFLADTLGWRWIFFINLIPGGFALYFIWRHFQEPYQNRGPWKLSLKSFLSSFLFITAFLTTLEYIQQFRYTWAIFLAVVTVASFGIFWHYEKTEKFPLIHPELLKRRMFLMSCLTGFLSSAVVLGLASFGPLLFQIVLGYSPTQSGFFLMPFTVAWLLLSIVSTQLILKMHYRKLLFVGFFMTWLGTALFCFFFYDLTTMKIIFCMLVLGVGLAFNYPITLLTTQYDAPKNLVGFSTSALMWVRNMGATISTAIMGVILVTTYRDQILQISEQDGGQELLRTLQENPNRIFGADVFTQIQANPILQDFMEHSLFAVFAVMFFATLLALFCAPFFPKKNPIILDESIPTLTT